MQCINELFSNLVEYNQLLYVFKVIINNKRSLGYYLNRDNAIEDSLKYLMDNYRLKPIELDRIKSLLKTEEYASVKIDTIFEIDNNVGVLIEPIELK